MKTNRRDTEFPENRFSVSPLFYKRPEKIIDQNEIQENRGIK